MENKKLKILITTGIYPPQIGGPAQYAKNLFETLTEKGNMVSVLNYRFENYLPTGIRHILFFFRVFIGLIGKDFCISLDTFSVGFPTVIAGKILRKKIIIRTGGDFLWEGYVERTNDLVLLRDFYNLSINKFNIKERVIFKLTKWTLNNANRIVFSTKWQMNIWKKPYNLNLQKTEIIENFYGKRELSELYSKKEKIFIASARPLKWKNLSALIDIFKGLKNENNDISLNIDKRPYKEHLEAIRHSYAVILVSLGDISPNFALDSLRLGKPIILTQENGLMDRIGDFVLTVNPIDSNDIKEKIEWLLNEENYLKIIEKIKGFNFTHSWADIADEFLNIYKNI